MILLHSVSETVAFQSGMGKRLSVFTALAADLQVCVEFYISTVQRYHEKINGEIFKVRIMCICSFLSRKEFSIVPLPSRQHTIYPTLLHEPNIFHRPLHLPALKPDFKLSQQLRNNLRHLHQTDVLTNTSSAPCPKK